MRRDLSLQKLLIQGVDRVTAIQGNRVTLDLESLGPKQCIAMALNFLRGGCIEIQVIASENKNENIGLKQWFLKLNEGFEFAIIEQGRDSNYTKIFFRPDSLSDSKRTSSES